MAKNIAVIGDAETIKGFSAVGLSYSLSDKGEFTAVSLRKES